MTGTRTAGDEEHDDEVLDAFERLRIDPNIER